MNLERLLGGILRRLLRQAMTRGIDAGIRQMGRGGDETATPGSRNQGGQTAQVAQRARQAGRLIRRIVRF